MAVILQGCFNGAGSDRSRKETLTPTVSTTYAGFNGAGSDRSRKEVSVPWAGEIPYCFNGAGSDRSRKVNVTDGRFSIQTASMGPGVIAPGKVPL